MTPDMTPEEKESKLCLARERVKNCDPARVLTDEEEEWLDRLPSPYDDDDYYDWGEVKADV